MTRWQSTSTRFNWSAKSGSPSALLASNVIPHEARPPKLKRNESSGCGGASKDMLLAVLPEVAVSGASLFTNHAHNRTGLPI